MRLLSSSWCQRWKDPLSRLPPSGRIAPFSFPKQRNCLWAIIEASWLDQTHRRSRWGQPQSMNALLQNKVHSISNYGISLDSNERAAFSYFWLKRTFFAVSFRMKMCKKASRSSSAGLLIHSQKAQLHTGSKRAAEMAWWMASVRLICNIYCSTSIPSEPHDAGMSEHFIKITISLKYSTIESEKKLFFRLKVLATFFFLSIKKCFFGGDSKDRLLPPAFSIKQCWHMINYELDEGPPPPRGSHCEHGYLIQGGSRPVSLASIQYRSFRMNAAALGCRCRVKTPFLFPTTRVNPADTKRGLVWERLHLTKPFTSSVCSSL